MGASQRAKRNLRDPVRNEPQIQSQGAAFQSEYQNDPIIKKDERIITVTADEISAKLNHFDRRRIPLKCNHIVGFIDVQAQRLFWGGCEEDDFTGYVTDYGVYPEQGQSYFSYSNVMPTLQQNRHGRS